MKLRATRWCLFAIGFAAASMPAFASCTAPPPPSSWIYRNGTYYWPGDWSGNYVSLNYDDTAGDAGTKDLAVKIDSPWGFWLPYCPQVGPDVNGYVVPTCNVSSYKSITLQLKATIPGQKWSLSVFKYTISGGQLVTDTMTGMIDDISPYGGNAIDGQFVTYTIPLAALGASGLTTMYKMLLQDQTGMTGQTWYVNNVAFE